MSEWVYLMHPPRKNFAATMSEQEIEVWGRHFRRLQELTAQGVVILAGPTLGPKNTGIVIFEAADEESANAIMAGDPTISEGYATGELRPFRVALMRDRDG